MVDPVWTLGHPCCQGHVVTTKEALQRAVEARRLRLIVSTTRSGPTGQLPGHQTLHRRWSRCGFEMLGKFVRVSPVFGRRGMPSFTIGFKLHPTKIIPRSDHSGLSSASGTVAWRKGADDELELHTFRNRAAALQVRCDPPPGLGARNP